MHRQPGDAGPRGRPALDEAIRRLERMVHRLAHRSAGRIQTATRVNRVVVVRHGSDHGVAYGSARQSAPIRQSNRGREDDVEE